jgi:glycosyltransferase involved in cell wall biosynthesis
MKKQKIVFIAPYPFGQAPSQRFRFEQYLPVLENAGFEYEFHSFLSTKTWKLLYQKGMFLQKALGIIGSFQKRFQLLFRLRKTDYIFIHREAAQLGPPIFEWIIAKVLKKKIIYDFDDAIWLPNYSENNKLFNRLKAYWKVKYCMKWAWKISAGNDYLANYALKYNSSVVVLPTTIDTENHHKISCNQELEPLTIGWTGTHTTLRYLEFLVPVIQELEQKYHFSFKVISNEAPKLPLQSLAFVKWNKATEIEDLASIQIGVMPLVQDIWSEGKCGFKALQYMALEIPTLLSPVGVNTKIVTDGENGFVVETPEEWKRRLVALITDKELRIKLGKKGKETIDKHYSVNANKTVFLNLFSL